MIQLNMSKKGEVVIPKKIRESLGFSNERPLFLELDGDKAVLTSKNRNVVQEMEEFAKKYGTDTSNWKMGDELYEEIFDVR